MLSYAILVYNEVKEIKKLLSILSEAKTKEDEIVILQDSSAPEKIIEEIKKICDFYEVDVYTKRPFAENFAKQKNILTALCTKDWIVNLDADEYIDVNFGKNIKEIILDNPEIDSIKIPRINIIENASNTFMEVQKNMPGYGWYVNEKNHINFPDYQERVYKNNSVIEWKGEVHEVISGAVNRSAIPNDYQFEELFIKHPKNVFRQFLQNYKYLNIMEDSRFTQEGYDSLLYVEYEDLDVDFDIKSKEDTIIILNKNSDYSYASLEEFLTNFKNKRIIWITNNLMLFLYLQKISKKLKNIETYLFDIQDTPNNSEFFYDFKKIKENVYRLIYVVNKKDVTNITRNLFGLVNNFTFI